MLLAGNAAVGLASINLSIRTFFEFSSQAKAGNRMAVWSQNRWIIGFLILLILGHWSLILQGVLLSAVWVDPVGCVITATNNRVLAATFVYSMCFDLVVLLLNAYKLLGVADEHFDRSLSFVANVLATVFMVINLNQIMSVIFNVPAAVASTIVASRVVRRLTNYTNPEVYTSSRSDGAVFRAGQQPTGTYTPKVHGVHVQMETFTHEECLDEIEVKNVERLRADSDTDNMLEAKTRHL
ncbi:hypothetical protein DXG01_011135 [Tephrocybe rancida]|nr:hypothetical protein DXG01_011135 [Tephrocybe rancida]